MPAPAQINAVYGYFVGPVTRIYTAADPAPEQTDIPPLGAKTVAIDFVSQGGGGGGHGAVIGQGGGGGGGGSYVRQTFIDEVPYIQAIVYTPPSLVPVGGYNVPGTDASDFYVTVYYHSWSGRSNVILTAGGGKGGSITPSAYPPGGQGGIAIVGDDHFDGFAGAGPGGGVQVGGHCGVLVFSGGAWVLRSFLPIPPGPGPYPIYDYAGTGPDHVVDLTPFENYGLAGTGYGYPLDQIGTAGGDWKVRIVYTADSGI